MGWSVWTREGSWKCVTQCLPACLGPLSQKIKGDRPRCPLPVGDIPCGVCQGLAAPLSHPSRCEQVGAKARGGHHRPTADPLLEPHGQSKTWELGGCFGA